MSKRGLTKAQIAAVENDAHVAFMRFHPKLETGLTMRIAPVIERLNAGAKLTREDQSSLNRWYAECEEQLRWFFYRAIPRRHWMSMGGLRDRTLAEHGARTGLPLGDPMIDLTAVVKAIHDQLRRGRGKPSSSEPTPKILGGDGERRNGSLSDAIKRENLLTAQRKRLSAEAELVARSEIHSALGTLSEILREASQKIQEQFGRDAYDIIDEALDEFEARLKTLSRVNRKQRRKS